MKAKRFLSFLMIVCMITGLTVGGAMNNKKEVKAAAGFSQNDFLKVNGTYVKNNYGKGSNVYLRGTNIGNLFVQESWMSSTDAKDQKTILENLVNRFGQSKADELVKYYEDNYFTTDDFDKCQKMGMSVLRVPFTYMNLYKKSGNNWVLRSDAFDRLDWIVDQASQRGIYVILDLHGAFGSQNGQDHSGQEMANVSEVTFFSNETLMSQTLDLWEKVASHYKGNPAVAGYDTLNEPGEKAGTTGEKHWKFYDRMYQRIRSVDPDHIIIMESCWGTGNLPNPSKYGWTNVMYEYHHYPWNYTGNTEEAVNGQKSSIDGLVNSVNNANYGVPTYIGEFNCFDANGAWEYTLDKMNNAGWHYTNWSYKSRGMGSWGIYHEYGSNDKVNPSTYSETDIKRVWGSSSIGTNASDTGITYNNLSKKFPGTIVKADSAYTNDSFMAIKASINNKYVCADNYGQSKLLADRDSYGEWEEFKVVKNNDGTYSFLSRANNKYLCAIFDDADTENPIRARSSKISDWEKFYIEKQSDGTYALRTYTNNKYVQADINDTTAGILHASADTVGTWERFVFEAQNASALPDAASATQPTQAATQAQGSSTTKFPNDYKVVAYYPNWYGNYTNKVQWDKITHAYYAFGLPSAENNGSIYSLNGEKDNVKAMVDACNAHNVVPVLSVGGWSHSGASDGLCRTVFANNTNTTAKCNSLAESIVSQAKEHGFKGVDIDWEYPTSSTQAQYTTFMKKLRSLCTENGMSLTVAVAATSGAGFTSEVLNMLDFVNIMAYDGNEGSGHSPYSLATDSFNYWKNTMGVPAKKLVIGVPFYERPNWASYADIVSRNSAYAQTDSAQINGQTVYYNGIPTMKKKAEYAAKNAGGLMIWEISQDSTNANLSLLNAIYDTTVSVLGNATQTTQQQTTVAPTTQQATTQNVVNTPGTIKVDSYSNKSDAITINNNNGVTYAGNLNNDLYLEYKVKIDNPGKYKLTLNLAAGDAQWNASGMKVDVDGASQGTVQVNGSSGWENFLEHSTIVNIPNAGTHTIRITAVNGAVNVADLKLDAYTEPTTTQAPTTQAPTTTKAQTTVHVDPSQIKVSNDLEINGYQISYTVKGLRTVYSCNNKVDGQNVVERGLVYGLKNKINDSDLYVGSSSAYVNSYKATAKGELGYNYSTNMPNATSYAMTMLFSNSSIAEFTINWSLRAYAKLEDGTYVYSNVNSYVIENVASKLYDGCKMQNKAGHEYLYNDILKKINPAYPMVDFDWGSGIVN